MFGFQRDSISKRKIEKIGRGKSNFTFIDALQYFG